MDIASIPRVESVVLTGLDFSMRPENARFEATKNFCQPLREDRVVHKIRTYAIMVYNQEKFTPMYHANVCESSNPLAYFLCAVHRQAAPQPQKKKDRHASIASNSSSNSEASSCASDRPGKNCELPELCIESALPLGYWDGLYYALVVEIRRLHTDLQDKFGWAIEQGIQPLHNYGADGVDIGPIAPIELASMLETAWYDLMDNRLVAALDDAVRMRKIRENAEARYEGGSSSEDDLTYERPPIIEGLVDVNGMTAEDIIGMLWDKHAPEVDRACAENFEDSSMFTVYRAELFAQAVDQARQLEAEPPSSRCNCRGKCICQLRCNVHTSHCTCAPISQVYFKVPSAGGETNPSAIWQDVSGKKQPGGFDTKTMMQLTMDPSFYARSLKAAQKPHEVAERNIPSRCRDRQRTDTNNSELAYVPDANRSRGKDVYPVGFCTDGSPGRYPKMRKDSSNDELFAAPYHTVARKPAPAPILLTQPYVAPDAGHGVTTPPPDHRYNPAAFLATKAQAAYQENHRLSLVLAQTHHKHQKAVVESFPVTTDNPRHAVNSDPFTDNASPTAEDYSGLLARHPSSFETIEGSTEPFPTFARSLATTPERADKSSKASVSTTNLPTLKSLSGDKSKPMPPLPPLPNLPQPDFIAPRPAKVQRYVSAGGTLPLAERPQIQGPAFHSTGFTSPTLPTAAAAAPGAVNHASGAGISKAELDAKMSDPEWVKLHFGAEAVPRINSSSSPPRGKNFKVRGSADSTASSVLVSGHNSRAATSQRVSEDTAPGGTYGPRDRNSSGVSSTKVSFKRLFSSRKDSTHENE